MKLTVGVMAFVLSFIVGCEGQYSVTTSRPGVVSERLEGVDGRRCSGKESPKIADRDTASIPFIIYDDGAQIRQGRVLVPVGDDAGGTVAFEAKGHRAVAAVSAGVLGEKVVLFGALHASDANATASQKRALALDNGKAVIQGQGGLSTLSVEYGEAQVIKAGSTISESLGCGCGGGCPCCVSSVLCCECCGTGCDERGCTGCGTGLRQ